MHSLVIEFTRLWSSSSLLHSLTQSLTHSLNHVSFFIGLHGIVNPNNNTLNVSDVVDKCAIVTPPKQGLVSWFKSSDLGTGSNAGNAWASAVGRFTAHPSLGTVKTGSWAGHGATRALNMVLGGTSSEYNFGPIIPERYTICSLTKYNGQAKKRILQGTRSDWLHGHAAGKAGIAYYGGWLNGHINRVNPVRNWVNMCGSSRVLFLDGSGVVGRRDDHVPGNQAVVINTGKFASDKSDWGVAEVMTWDRELSEEEMQRASKYLRQVLHGVAARARLLLFREHIIPNPL